MCQNTKKADDDACVYKKFWAFMGFGSPATGCIHKMPGMSKGDQQVILSDVGLSYSQGCFNHYMLVKKNEKFPVVQLKNIVDQMDLDSPASSIGTNSKAHQKNLYHKIHQSTHRKQSKAV